MDNYLNYYHFKKLMKCEVRNKKQESSVRFIEWDYFKLWEYLMIHKHGMQVVTRFLHLWLNEEEFIQKAAIYQRFDQIEKVNRLEMLQFDTEYGVFHGTCRYVVDSEIDKVKTILLSHLPSHVITNQDFDISITPGYCIAKITQDRPSSVNTQ